MPIVLIGAETAPEKAMRTLIERHRSGPRPRGADTILGRLGQATLAVAFVLGMLLIATGTEDGSAIVEHASAAHIEVLSLTREPPAAVPAPDDARHAPSVRSLREDGAFATVSTRQPGFAGW